MIRRPPRSTLDRSSAASDVYKRQGYDNIPTVLKINITLEKKTDETEIDEKLRQAATALGFFEMINNPLQLSLIHISEPTRPY